MSHFDVIFLGVLSEPERRRYLAARAGEKAAANGGPAAMGSESEAHRPTSRNGNSGGEPFAGANGHEGTMVDAPVGAALGVDGDGLSAGTIAADAAPDDRRL